MCMHCDDEYILQEGGTVLSKWHVKQCAHRYLESSLCAKTALSQWKPSGAFSYAFVLNQTISVCQQMQSALGLDHGQVEHTMEVCLGRKERPTDSNFLLRFFRVRQPATELNQIKLNNE